MLNFGYCLVFVVSYCFDEYCNIIGFVIFIGEFFVIVVVVIIGVLFNGVFDGVFFYIGSECFVDNCF